MSKRIVLSVVIGLLLIGMHSPAWAGVDLRVKDYVTDKAELLSDSVRTDLNTELRRFDQETGNQILVIVIPSLKGQELVQLTEDYFKLNKLGQKGKDNGVILLVAKQERKIRIEVGYGLEAVIHDAKAGAIIRDVITPCFKDNDYERGIINGVKSIIAAIDPDYRLKTKQAKPQLKHKIGWLLTGVVYLILAILAGVLLMGLYFILTLVLIIVQKIVRFINWLLIKRLSPELYLKIDRSLICKHQFPYLFGGTSSGGDTFGGGGGSFGGGGASGDW